MHQKQNPAGFYTKGEEIFNAVSHGAGSVLAIGGTGALVALAAALANWRTVLICLVYGLSLVVLYTMSTLYHAFPFEGVKRLFRVFDHSSIYLLIAGSYTPFTLILLDGTWKGFWLLLLGGVSYTGGIVFYAWHKKGRVHYMHGVWHLFVLLGSVLHYLCILLYVLPRAYA